MVPEYLLPSSQKPPPPSSQVRSLINPVRTLPPYFLIIHFNIILPTNYAQVFRMLSSLKDIQL